MRLSHARAAISVRFDDPNLVSCAGLVPVMALAARCGLTSAAGREAHAGREGHRERGRRRSSRWSRGWSRARTRSPTWTCCATAGWAASSTGCGRRRRWARSCARSPSATSANSTPSPPGCWPGSPPATPLLPGADQMVFVDIDDTVRQTYGYAKQGAGRGYTGVKGLERAARGALHPDLGAGDRRHPAAQGIDELRPRRGEAAGRRAGHRPAPAPDWPTAAGAGAGGLGLLRLRHHRRLPPGRGPVLHHRPAHPDRGQGHHQHRRAGVDPDPLPERDLRRGRAAVGLRRRGRRGRLHRVHRAPQAPSTSPPG